MEKKTNNRIKKFKIFLVILLTSLSCVTIKKHITDDPVDVKEESVEEIDTNKIVEKYCEEYGVNKEVALSILLYNNGLEMGSYYYNEYNNPGVLPCMIDHKSEDDVELVPFGKDDYVLKYSSKEAGIKSFIKMLKNDYKFDETSDMRTVYNYTKYCPFYEYFDYNNISTRINEIYKNIDIDYDYYSGSNIKKLVLNR